MNLKLYFHTLIICLLLTVPLEAQSQDLSAVYHREDGTISQLLFTNNGSGFGMSDAFRARSSDLYENHARLTVSGDFTGDGLDEIAFFDDLLYTPNMNPDFTCSVVRISRSMGDYFLPAGSWFSVPDTVLNFDHVDFSVAADYNQDGYCDIALLYNDPASDELAIYMLRSNGSGFAGPRIWYRCPRIEFNFTAIKFALAGDFNGNEKQDIAMFYNYSGTAPETSQDIFLFESSGAFFKLLPAVFHTTKAAYDFSDMISAHSGYFNPDPYSDIAVVMNDPSGMEVHIPVFEGSASNQLSPAMYLSLPDTELELEEVILAASGEFAGDEASDLALFYNNPGSGNQEILVLENDQNTFKDPEVEFLTDPDSMQIVDISAVVSGKFAYKPLVSVATWKNDRKGAVSFTFDDGYRGAFEHGGAELEAVGLKGTFYIFTDTSAVYDGELASTSLVKEYKDKGHEIASHTDNHANLGLLTASGDLDSVSEVLSRSVELLNERFDQSTFSMSIPFGSFRYETLKYISEHFFTARSSQFGFNLPTPYDFFALKSWPVLSTTSPAYVDNLLSKCEAFGTYLPLMYHDMVDEPFDEDLLIYTYSRTLFAETVQTAKNRDLWIDTHASIYKYIRERNALKINITDIEHFDSLPGLFSFEADDGLEDSIFNVELTLKIYLPVSWLEDTLTIGPEGEFNYIKVQEDSSGRFIYYNYLPVSGISLQVHDGKLTQTGLQDRPDSLTEVDLLVYPNPFIHETRIQGSGISKNDAYLIVRDIQGRIVREIRGKTGDSYRLTRQNLPSGIYIIQLIDSGIQVAALKLVAY